MSGAVRRGNRHPALRVAAAMLLAGAVASGADAAVFRIDETGTTVSQPTVAMKWRHIVPRPGADNTLQATVRVDLRLNLQPWLNRPARIYMVLAPVTGERLRARWTTQGRLLGGSMLSGERALLYDGIAGPATLTEALLLTLEANGDAMHRPETLNFHFEIEVAP